MQIPSAGSEPEPDRPLDKPGGTGAPAGVGAAAEAGAAAANGGPWVPLGEGAASPYASPKTGFYQPAPQPAVAGEIRHQLVDPGSVISYAWEVWKLNLGLLVGIFVFLGAINLVLTFGLAIMQAVLEQADAEEVAVGLSLLGNLAINAVGIYLTIGQVQITLKLARRQRAVFSDVFQGGPRFLPVLGALILAALAMFAGFLMCIIPAIVLALLFWPFYFLVIDDKASVIESFSKAYTITQANVGTSFVLWLASCGIMLLGFLAVCVGVIFAAPLVSLVWAVAYLMMSGQLPSQPALAKGY